MSQLIRITTAVHRGSIASRKCPTQDRRWRGRFEGLEQRALLSISPPQLGPGSFGVDADNVVDFSKQTDLDKASLGSLQRDTTGSRNPAVATALLPVGVTRADLAAQLGEPSDANINPAALLSPPISPLVAAGESEPNNSPATANPVPLGFGPGEDVAVDVSASIGPLPVVIPTGEDDGSIPLANPTGLVSGSVVTASATIGNGPFGATSGDYDFYSLLGLSVGDVVTVDIDADILGSELDSFLLVYDSVGNLFTFNDDFDTFDSYLEFPAINAGDYYVAVFGYFSGIPDPFDSSSGDGADSTGDYQIKIGLNLPPVTIISPTEDDGSIPLANPTGLVSGSAVGAIGFIGDGPYGFSSGDYDFYQVPSVAAGDVITVDIGAEEFFTTVDSVVGIYDSAGNLMDYNDDYGSPLDSFLEFTAPYADDYYVVVFDYFSDFPFDPFDSSSGSGAGNIDFYLIKIGLNIGDADFYALDLNAGDILGANIAGGAKGLSLRDSSGVELLGSHQDASFIYPAASPLPGGGNAALAWVIDTPGTYYVGAGGSGLAEHYDLNLRVFRPVLEAELIGTHQILFLDFDGANVDRPIFGGGGVAVLSPLSSFLGGWGLAPGDESAVIDAIVASIEENLSADIRALGNNGDYDASLIPGQFDIEIRNSRDHADPWGLANVSRVVIGGTIDELGIGTIAIAERIDVGNFDTTETAVVLLDLLSASAANPNSLNQFPLDPAATKFDIIGSGVGNIASHEAGHLFANFHTDQFNGFENADLMDQGGFLANIVGVGEDYTFGSPDDVDVDFGQDTFVPDEGFTGVENTLNAIAYGLSTGTIPPPPDFVPPTVTSVVVSSPAWTGAFLTYLETHGLGTGGYAIPVGNGAAQFATLPWTNLRQIKMTFSENVVVAANDLKVAGVNVPSYALPPVGFSYNAATHVATWTFASNLNADKLLLALDSTAVSGVHDAAGNRLDGEWDNPTGTADPSSDTFPSGNGAAGGHFNFRINVLPGDTTGNRITFIDDSMMTALRVGANTSSSRYAPRFDVDGSGAINSTDMSLIAARYISLLPTREPVAPVFPAAARAVVEAVFAEIGSRRAAEDAAAVQLAFLDDDGLLGAKKTSKPALEPLVTTAAKTATALTAK